MKVCTRAPAAEECGRVEDHATLQHAQSGPLLVAKETVRGYKASVQGTRFGHQHLNKTTAQIHQSFRVCSGGTITDIQVMLRLRLLRCLQWEKTVLD